jgi:hypothetical protein
VRGTTGHPCNLLAGTDINGDHNALSDRPVGVGRKSGRGPEFWTADLRLGREFALAEKAQLRVMAEAFNLFNRRNYAGVNNFVGSISAPFNVSGTSLLASDQPVDFTSAYSKREIGMGMRLHF